MNKTFNINLGGYPFTIDEDAYEHLRQYLDALKAAEPRQKNNQMIKYPAKVSSLSSEQEKK